MVRGSCIVHSPVGESQGEKLTASVSVEVAVENT